MKFSRSRCPKAAALAIWAISMALPVAAQDHPHYSGSELRRMMREASSADQYRTLATWFREEEAVFRSKAEAENKDYERYRVLVRTKVPTRADNARSRRDSYLDKAGQMAKLAAHYEAKLSQVDPNYQPVSASASAAAGALVTTDPCASSPAVKMLLDKIQRLEMQVDRPREQ